MYSEASFLVSLFIAIVSQWVLSLGLGKLKVYMGMPPISFSSVATTSSVPPLVAAVRMLA